MSILEVSNIFGLSVVTAGFIVTIGTVTSLLITKALKKFKKKVLSVWKKKKPVAENLEFVSDESLVSVSLKNHLNFLKVISQKTAEDRTCIEKLFSEGNSEFEENILAEVECIQPSIRERIYSSLQQKYFAQDQQAKDIFKTLEALESDFLILKNELQHVSPVLMKLAKTEFPKSPFSNTDVVPTQSTGLDEDSWRLHENISGSELVTSILTATKESFEELVLENRKRGKEMIQSVVRFQEQSQKDIEKEIFLFSSVANGSEQDNRSNTNFSLITEVEKIENLLEGFIFFNRQRFEMENMKKTLTYFTEKFLYVAEKFDAYWQQSTASYSSAAQRLEETEVLMSSVTKKMKNNADCLLQETNYLVSIIAIISDVLNLKEYNIDSWLEFTNSEGGAQETSYESDAKWNRNIHHVNEKLDQLLVLSENSSGKLNSLTLTCKDLENLRNLISSMTEGYNALLSFFLSSMEKSRKLKNLESVALSENCQTARNLETYDEMRVFARGDNWASDDNLWNEVANELNSEFPNSDIHNIVFILKDIVKTTWNLVGYWRTRLGNERDVTDPMENSGHNDTLLQEKSRWDCIQSESSLDNVTSDYLVQNSDESDEVSE